MELPGAVLVGWFLAFWSKEVGVLFVLAQSFGLSRGPIDDLRPDNRGGVFRVWASESDPTLRASYRLAGW